MKTVIRRYDKHRVCILPQEGLPERAAEWMTEYAQKTGIMDFKVVKTQDEHGLLGVVCRPKTWFKLVKVFRNWGIDFETGVEDAFLVAAKGAMAEGSSVMHNKEKKMPKKDREWLNEQLKRIEERGMTKEESEKMDAEVEENLKEQEQSGELVLESNERSRPKRSKGNPS